MGAKTWAKLLGGKCSLGFPILMLAVAAMQPWLKVAAVFLWIQASPFAVAAAFQQRGEITTTQNGPRQHSLSPETEELARQYRIQIYNTFRARRNEYNARRAAWEQLRTAWSDAGSQAADDQVLAAWLKQALVASRPGSVTRLPEIPDLAQNERSKPPALLPLPLPDALDLDSPTAGPNPPPLEFPPTAPELPRIDPPRQFAELPSILKPPRETKVVLNPHVLPGSVTEPEVKLPLPRKPAPVLIEPTPVEPKRMGLVGPDNKPAPGAFDLPNAQEPPASPQLPAREMGTHDVVHPQPLLVPPKNIEVARAPEVRRAELLQPAARPVPQDIRAVSSGVEVNLIELAARIRGYNRSLALVEDELLASPGWDGEELGQIANEVKELAKLYAELQTYVRLLEAKQRETMEPPASLRTAITLIQEKIPAVRKAYTNPEAHAPVPQRAAALESLTRLSESLAELENRCAEFESN